ncbi:hypothetical protein [Brassicibacter mesophilus]|uniref:hypothetical protein n=1 Tax=Brassicibacter mesophilus TaxID=745119 RepID=UPI003D1927DF
MTKISKENKKVYIENVPRGGYDFLDCMFPSYFTSAINAIGGKTDYNFIMGVTGAAFRLVWNSNEWDAGNSSLNFATPDPLQPFIRAFNAVGKNYKVIGKNKYDSSPIYQDRYFDKAVSNKEDSATFKAKIIESINKGIPVLAFGVIGPPECCLITGYDDGGDVLLGWNFFQDAPPLHTEKHDTTGYFRKHGWYEQTPFYFLIGEDTEVPSFRNSYVSSLKLAVTMANTFKVRERHGGLAAYKAWADALLDDSEFAGIDEENLFFKKMVHDDSHGCLYSSRAQAALFLKNAAEIFPEAGEEFNRAASAYKEEHDIALFDVKGEFADFETRRQIAKLIMKAREKEIEAVDYIKRGIEKIKSINIS